MTHDSVGGLKVTTRRAQRQVQSRPPIRLLWGVTE